MQPEASRLTSRIIGALKGESGGLDTAKLAWQYATAIDDANQRITQCHAALANNDEIGCHLIANQEPELLDTVATLDIDQTDDWKRRCQNYSWKTTDPLFKQEAATLQSKLDEVDDLKEFLYTEYRNRIRAKHPLDAYPIIELLARKYKDDANTIEEHQRLSEQLKAQAVTELKASIEELIPAEKTADVLARYQAIGLEIESSEDTIQNILGADTERLTQKATTLANQAIEAAKTIDQGDDDWKTAETAFLACDYFLATTETRGSIANELREDLEKAGTAIGHKRYGSESIIRLRAAIDQTKHVLAGGKIAGAHGRTSARTSRINAIDHLKSAEAQTRKLGNRIHPDLQKEIDDTLAIARRKGFPRLAGIAAAGLALLFIGYWGIDSFSDNADRVEAERNAYDAVLFAQKSNLITSAEKALSQHSETIASADPASDLSREAKALKTWQSNQRQLDADYAALAKRIEEHDRKDQEALKEFFSASTASRQTLAKDLGQDSTQRIAAIQEEIEVDARQREAEYHKQIAIATKQARSHLQNAAVADSKNDFRSHAAKAGKAIFNADQLAQTSGLADEIEESKKNIESIRSEISTLEKNWNALASTADKLSTVTTFEEFAGELKRIHGFDILPKANKNNIERALRNLPTTTALKQQLLMPGDTSAWIEFADNKDYRRTDPKVSDVERVYLERLANDSFFETIYESKVKYFEGAPVALNEYTAFLFDPVSKTETGVRTGVNYTFKIRGFDESGDPETEAREMNFLSHPDGSFWGFFYEPSSLSKESQYYQETIRVELLKVLAGAPRFTLVNLVDQISANRSLSPAFRAYWHQQIFSFMKMNPWKWGMPLSPSLQQQSKELTRIARGEFSKRDWLSTIEQSAPSLELTQYFQAARKLNLANECRAFASLYQIALEGDFEIAGHIDADAKLQKRKSTEKNSDLWALNALTGQIESLATLNDPAPYSPIIRYAYEKKPAAHVLHKTKFITGTNLAAPPYEDSLPPLFDHAK